ncbi:GFA family protein [Marinomonas posidonica]|uniref:Glutathione-dependent formaldehyde-activating GFA n=1 Tax=Marinomonas posidonica (strain CECT 7376 / NCIMB 14433 / IVIA-Po-181) TaxID=491952 RepID=F6CUY6_MARPP|nr:GFA family protein [Marinomonas posidonica]AEF55312.1 glutathione-dependent formaldehyde-activating GFA [Marinomonas posidonica IVIA-Po-181]
MEVIFGSCLCGEVKFKCENTFSQFHLCHCSQCQKTTGSAHASNLFTQPENIEWVAGEDCVKRYDLPGRAITSAFCKSCGSPVPYLSISGKALVIPAGILESAPNISPQDNIFWSEHASWYEAGIKSKKYDGFPT